MQVNHEQVLRMAHLARLDFTPAEVENMAQSLNQLVEYMAMLKTLDLKNVEPMLAVDTSARPLREDVVIPSLDREAAFKNAPAVNLDHFSIPKVMGG